jgi:hypothetical protein
MHRVSYRIVLLAVFAAFLSINRPAEAVTLRIDYGRDTNNFFPAGSQARAAMEEAATFYSGILEDTLSEIETPAKFLGSLGGEVTWHWRRSYINPSGVGTIFETDTDPNNPNADISLDADELVVFVGARDLPGDEAGLGGPGGWLWTGRGNGQFTSAEESQWNDIQDDFESAVIRRQEANGFATWGGAISFDSNTSWHFNHTTNPGAGLTDFYSVALHELAHVLGFGAVDNDDEKDTEWEARVNGTNFTGSNANIQHAPAAQVPLDSADDVSHWLQGIQDSTAYGAATSQKPLMVPGIDPAIRRLLTNLDAAALVDIGWSIDLPNAAAAATSLAVLNTASGSASFTASALTAVTIVPEPGGLLLGIIAAPFVLASRSRWKR